jgi:hypothetical protein
MLASAIAAEQYSTVQPCPASDSTDHLLPSSTGVRPVVPHQPQRSVGYYRFRAAHLGRDL